MDNHESPDTGFGTGLRAYLGSAPPEGSAPEGAPVEVELSELDRRQQELTLREEELLTLERRLREEAAALRAEVEGLAQRAAELDRRESALHNEQRPVRELLRERAEMFGERIWTVFDEALEAKTAEGEADFATRLAAVQALVRSAYGTGAGTGTDMAAAVYEDIAALRRSAE